MDGRAENFEGYSKQTRPLAVQGPLCDLPKKLPADDLYVHQEVPAPPDPPERIHKTMCGQTLSSFPQYRRIKNLKMPRKNFCLTYMEGHTSKECVCEDCWRQAHIKDSWDIQVRAMIHVCGPSCWKYNSNGIRICRHHCYHITILEPDTSAASPAEKPLKLRRDGRPLNNQLFIQEDATKGKRGRIVPITVMPFETMTNYGAAGSLRCNFDNQSLLYLLPGSVSKLLHSPNIGRKPEYAHMERKEGDMNPKWLLPVADGSVETDEVDTRPADDIETCEALLKELESECLSAFQDAHNTGFYINEYTTKVNALGDKILEGLRRASEKIVREEAARTPDVAEDAKRRADRERIKAVLKKLVYLMNSLQVKSGSELAFPMLFDHMSFSTHRTWEMNMKVPYAKALSSWENHFRGSLKALRQDTNFARQLGFILPSELAGPMGICQKDGS